MRFPPAFSSNLRAAAVAFAMAGLFAAFYYACDIKYPNHFVGDMYGMEVMSRAFLLMMTGLPLCAGLLVALISWKKEETKLTELGLVLADICAAVLIVMALNVFHDRAIDDIRKTYPQKSTNELLRIAAKEKDQFAIYELLARKDRTAVPALSRMLLDRNELPRIRTECAHALGQIGGDEAKAALQQAASMPGGNQYLSVTISYSLENIDKQADR